MVLDPQYRTILDAMDYGNEGARQRDRVALPQMCDELIGLFGWEADRIIMPSGYVMLWTDKIGSCSPPQIIVNGRKVVHATMNGFKLVDRITWDRQKLGMGYRSRAQS